MFDFANLNILGIFFVFLRVSGMLFALPIFGDLTTPLKFRILLSIGISATAFPLIDASWLKDLPTDVMANVVIATRELVIGLVIGFISRLIFDGFILGASIVGYQMGFGSASLMMPDVPIQADGFTAFHRMLIILIFLALDLHHIFLKGIFDSFQIVPQELAALDGTIGQILIEATAGMFIVGLQIAAPVLVAILFATAALGLMARTVPQMNVFTMSFPISFFIGLLVYLSTVPFFPAWVRKEAEVNFQYVALALENLIR